MRNARPARLVWLVVVAVFATGAARAQETPAPASTTAAKAGPAKSKKHSHSVPGTPLDTLMSTHLTATVGEAQDFVKASRPDPRTLSYTPLTGTDPERPKLRDAANIAALQAELEQGAAANETRARGLRPTPAKHAPRKTTEP